MMVIDYASTEGRDWSGYSLAEMLGGGQMPRAVESFPRLVYCADRLQLAAWLQAMDAPQLYYQLDVRESEILKDFPLAPGLYLVPPGKARGAFPFSGSLDHRGFLFFVGPTRAAAAPIAAKPVAPKPRKLILHRPNRAERRKKGARRR